MFTTKKEQARRQSLQLNQNNLLTKDQLKSEYLCSLCQAILVDPVECKQCKSRFHHKCLEKFHNETGMCPMQCVNPKFLSVKKEVEKKLMKMQFKCRNHLMGCNEVLGYTEVATHDQNCIFQPVKCQAYTQCKTKCIRKEIEQHEAVCPYISVPCIYCRQMVQRMNIVNHENNECKGTHICGKCGMTVQKSETQKTSHNCFTALAGYLTNMLDSKDYIINMFKDEIQRKNQLISELIERMELLESKLTKVEAVLMFEDEDYEALTGVKKQNEANEDGKANGSATINQPQQDSVNANSSQKENDDDSKLTPEQLFENQVMKIDESWREHFREAQMYIEELRQGIFEPSSDWCHWQQTKNYTIKTRITERNLLAVYSQCQIDLDAEQLLHVISDYGNKPEWDTNFQEGRKLKNLTEEVQLHYLRTKKIAVVSSRDQVMIMSLRRIPANQSPSGRKTMIIAVKSVDHKDYPENQGVVRATTPLSGWWIEELPAPQTGCMCHFLLETDFKISLFIQKQVGPKSSNYAGKLKEWIDSQLEKGVHFPKYMPEGQQLEQDSKVQEPENTENKTELQV